MPMENRFNSIWNHVNEGILISDKSGKIVLANPRCAALFGYSEEEMLKIDVDQLIPDAARSRHKQHREQYNDKPANRLMGHHVTLYGLKKDSSVFPVEISLSHYNSQGETFVIAFVVEVTERLKFQEDLKRMNKQLLTMNENLERKVKERTLVLQEALNDLEKTQIELREGLLKEKELHEMKSRFVTMASHEFRTPLTTVLSSVSLISKYTKEDEQVHRDKHIQRIKNSVFSLTEILNDILSLGKLDEGKVEIQLEEINLDEVLLSVVNDMDFILKPNQKIEVICPINQKLKADITLLQRVIVNLLSNAIKFSFEETNILVEVVCKKEINEVQINISNQGIGIPSNEQSKLFDRFFRANNASNIQGTGLGLSIVKRCLELMGASITLESIENSTTTFTIHTPLQS
jgi:PAS domain S-box-containing protein